MTEKNIESELKIKAALENLSDQDFRNFGIQHIAYIREVQKDSKIQYSVHTADGTEISVMDTLDKAILASRQSDLEPVTVH